MKFIAIDREGYYKTGELRVSDQQYGFELIKNLRVTEKFETYTESGGEKIIVESFDEPFLVEQVFHEKGGAWIAQMPYKFVQPFQPENLTLDEWDRFHGRTEANVPFVFSRKAQTEFFNLLDDYSDTSITISGKTIEIPPYFSERDDLSQSGFWTNIYQTEVPGWELEAPSPALVYSLPQLKLIKLRVLVLGCGTGNDAAFFAESGHIVTAVDFSAEAVARAKKKYGHISNLTFVEHDVFNLPDEWRESFDLVFEHTCFCAISPTRRNELVNVWRRVLVPSGYVLGIFFVMPKSIGPPFGGSEWELEQRLKKHFRFLYWTRTHDSIPERLGKEIVVFSQKL